MIRFCPLLHVVPQGVSPLGISTGDMMVVARSFPSLRTLALSDIDQAALGWEQECKLKPLSQLTGLTDLSIAARRVFPDSTLASLSSLKRLASLKLQLIRVHDGFDGFCQQVFPHLRSLWGLRHLAHLSCTYIDSKPPPCIGRVTNNPDNVLQPHRVAAPPLDLFSTGRMITTLSGCKKLSSMQMPWAVFAEGAAERLAKELPQLTRLSVNCLWPGAPMPACSWREVTLCGGSQMLSTALFQLPLEGLERLHIAHPVQGYAALAVLRGFHRISWVYNTSRFWYRAKIFNDQRQCFLVIYFSCYQQYRIIGLVIFFVECLQVLYGHALYIFFRTYRCLTVIVPQICGGKHTLHQHIRWPVLSRFKFISYHAELTL